MSTVFVDVRQKSWYSHFMLTPEQSRAARGWLDWTQEDLAKKAQVSLSTIRDFEKGRRVPIKNNLDAIQLSFEIAGVKFVFRGEAPLGIQIFSGSETG